MRWVYNEALAIREKTYRETGKNGSYEHDAAALVGWKEENEWLGEVPAVPLQQSLRHLQAAYRNFFQKRAAKPSFKRKGGPQSAAFMRSAFRWDGQDLRLAKMAEPLPIRWSRQFKGVPSSVTVSLDTAGRYHVSLLVDEEIEPLPPVERTVGIDCGLKHAVIPSHGEPIDNPHYFRHDERRLAKAQRNLSRKQKGSRNRAKARRKVARIHAHIANQRRDWLHKLTTKLIRENQVVCAESLMVKNLVHNRRLAKAIHDVAWGELLRQLDYKATWYGRAFVQIGRWFPSSKTCHDCGCVLDKLPLSAREWTCPSCGAFRDRDLNASLNIEAEGLRLLESA